MPTSGVEHILDRLHNETANSSQSEIEIRKQDDAVGLLQPAFKKRKRLPEAVEAPTGQALAEVSFEGLPARPDLEGLSTLELRNQCRDKGFIVKDGDDWLDDNKLKWQLAAGQRLSVVRRKRHRRA